jgi:DNA-binding MarR family transcriptional regulator
MKDFRIGQVDEIIHGRVRLGIMAYLSSQGRADFTELRKALAVSDGALSIHLHKLEEAGHVALKKSFVAAKPRTRVSLTEDGRAAYAAYLEVLASLIGLKPESSKK